MGGTAKSLPPPNKKYANVKARLDTGCNELKIKGPETKANARFHRGENFKRLKVHTMHLPAVAAEHKKHRHIFFHALRYAPLAHVQLLLTHKTSGLPQVYPRLVYLACLIPVDTTRCLVIGETHIVQVSTLLALMQDFTVDMLLLDLRDEEAYTQFHLRGGESFSCISSSNLLHDVHLLHLISCCVARGLPVGHQSHSQ